MKWTVHYKSSWLIFSFSAAFVALLILTTIIYFRIDALQLAISRVDQTNAIILRNQSLRIAIKNTQLHEKDYLYSGKPEFREKYQYFYQRSLRLCDTLLRLTEDNTSQYARVQHITQLLQYRFADSLGIDARTEAENKKGLSTLQRLREKTDTTLEDLIRAISTEERLLYKDHLRSREYNTGMTPLYLFATTFFTAVILLLSFLFLLREFRHNQKLRRSLAGKVEELTETNIYLSRIVYVASHHLQEPLRKILLFGNYIRSTLATTDTQHPVHQPIDRINTLAQRARDLLHDLVRYTELTRTSRKHQRVRLGRILKDTLQKFKKDIEACQAQVCVTDLPEITASTEEMRILFEQLIDNSLKYRNPDTPLQITISSRKVKANETVFSKHADGLFHHIQVSDNGIGFTPAFSEKIFELFQKLEGGTDAPGTGIGLALCKRIAENHGGFIHAEGSPHYGATFHVFLPTEIVQDRA